MQKKSAIDLVGLPNIMYQSGSILQVRSMTVFQIASKYCYFEN